MNLRHGVQPLDETAASYQELQQAHAATLDELAWYRRWTFGQRRERFAAGEGQGHLFELESPLSDELPAPKQPDIGESLIALMLLTID